jgi:hypothetical protein
LADVEGAASAIAKRITWRFGSITFFEATDFCCGRCFSATCKKTRVFCDPRQFDAGQNLT